MHRTSRLVAVGAALASVAAIAPAASAAQPHFSPGAPGIGDPYYPLEGNGGYHALHYGLDLKYNPPTKRLDGVVTMTARATQNLSRFDLDLKQLTVSKVSVNGHKAKFTRKGQELIITPKSGIRKNKRFTVTVRYGGVPKPIVGVDFGTGPEPYGFVHTHDGAYMSDEPDAASTWFPCNDHPADKAAFTFKVTVPKGLGVIANGRLVSKRTKGAKTTFVWDEKTPMATYLATAGIGKWHFKTGKTPGGIPQTIAVDPKLKGRQNIPDPTKYFWDTTAEATDLWVKQYGKFPFDSTGAIADLATYNGKPLGTALETQTRPLYPDLVDTNTIAHELAHQWFGDSVSVKTWQHIWLNESFASFADRYWDQKHGGKTLHDEARAIYNDHAANDAWWKVVIADPKRDKLFHDRVYSGGAMMLQFLREKIGDEAFFKILRTWTAQHRHGNATTEQFTALAQKVSGQDLSGFFKTWLYSPGKPALPKG